MKGIALHGSSAKRQKTLLSQIAALARSGFDNDAAGLEFELTQMTRTNPMRERTGARAACARLTPRAHGYAQPKLRLHSLHLTKTGAAGPFIADTADLVNEEIPSRSFGGSKTQNPLISPVDQPRWVC